MLEKSLFICYSTPNYSKLTHLCLSSLHDINVTNILGTNIFNKNKSLLHHAVCCRDVDDKIIQIDKIKSEF